MGDPIKPPKNVGELIVGGAYETGLITRQSVDTLLALPEITREIDRGVGDSTTGDFLVSVVPDDSRSIFYSGNHDSVALGHNEIIDELQELGREPGSNEVLVHTRYLNGKVLNAYTPVAEAAFMTGATYQDHNLGTPLYDQTVIALGTTIAKTAQLSATGGKVRTFTLIISDGADQHSRAATPESVAWIVGDMLASGGHIIAAMGVEDGQTDFRAVYQRMGIRPGWILTAKDSREAIRRALRVVKDAMLLAAGSEEEFARLSLGPGLG